MSREKYAVCIPALHIWAGRKPEKGCLKNLIKIYLPAKTLLREGWGCS
jgi:hypothetical protein